MASIFDVAKYILNRKKVLGIWKLQKLCYYSQAWHVAWTDKPLFNEKFIKWINGPVCKDLLIMDGDSPIFLYRPDTLDKGDIDNLSYDEKESIDIVLDTYLDKRHYELEELSLSEEPCASVDLKDEIPWESMKDYYGGLMA